MLSSKESTLWEIPWQINAAHIVVTPAKLRSWGIYWLLDNSALSDRFPGVNQIMATMLYEQEQHRESNTQIKIALYVYVVVLNSIVLDRSFSYINSLTEIIGCG